MSKFLRTQYQRLMFVLISTFLLFEITFFIIEPTLLLASAIGLGIAAIGLLLHWVISRICDWVQKGDRS